MRFSFNVRVPEYISLISRKGISSWFPHRGSRVLGEGSQIEGPRSQVKVLGPGSHLWIPGPGSHVQVPVHEIRVLGPTFLVYLFNLYVWGSPTQRIYFVSSSAVQWEFPVAVHWAIFFCHLFFFLPRVYFLLPEEFLVFLDLFLFCRDISSFDAINFLLLRHLFFCRDLFLFCR